MRNLQSIWSRVLSVIGLGLVFAGSASTALGLDVVTPEIDPGSASAALTFLTGGMLVLKSRLRNK